MAPGRKTGGRKKGTPNKVTSEAREAFALMFHSLAPDVEAWIRQTANGWDEEVTIGKGEAAVTAIKRTGKDPGKAADLAIRLAEYHIPKLGRTEVTGEDGGPVEFVVRDIAKEKPDPR
jgi:hypothetical protein